MGEALVLTALAALCAMLVGAIRLLSRIVARGPGHALSSLQRSSRSLFGPNGPPEELCRSLIQKQPTLSAGPHGGLSFTGAGCRGRLDFISDRTEIRFELDERARETVEVSTPSILTRLAEDDPDSFKVRGSARLHDQVFANRDLGRMLRSWGVAFEWTFGPPGYCLVIHGLPHDEEELWRWLNGAFALLQAVPGFEREAFVRVEAPTRVRLSDSHCQVCGDTLAREQVVYCRRCVTPHHEECWTYAQECSTFGCKERQFVRHAS